MIAGEVQDKLGELLFLDISVAVDVHLLENLLESLVVELVALAELLVDVLHGLEAFSVVEFAVTVGVAGGEDGVNDSVEFSEGVGHLIRIFFINKY